MNVKLIAGLGIAILAMVLAVFVAQDSRKDENTAASQLVLPGLAEKLGQLDSVVIASTNTSVTLIRQESGWVVSERADYPADFDKLSELLRGMAAAKFVERKTARAENHALLGVRGIDDESSEAVLVKVSAGSDKFELLYGNESEAGQGIFARLPDEAQVWLVSRQTKPLSSPAAWIRSVALNIDAERIVSVQHASQAGELLVTRDAESGDFTVDSLPADTELQYATVANVLSRALVNLRATDVRQRGSEDWVPTLTATFTLVDGTLVMVAGAEVEGEYWLQIDVTAGEDGASGIDLDTVGKYEFMVAEYTFNQFRKSMKDMVRSDDADLDSEED